MEARTCKYSVVELVPEWGGWFGAAFRTLEWFRMSAGQIWACTTFVHAGEEDFLDQLGQGE